MKSEETKSGFWQTFVIWFGLGAMMFGTYCGGAMVSGTYATGYFARFGGGYMLNYLLIFIVIMGLSCILGLNFIRCYKVKNYNEYYLAMYGLQDPNSNKFLRSAVTLFFDAYTTFNGILSAGATVALLANLFVNVFGIPYNAAGLVVVAIFGFLSINGAGFLRKFNTAMTLTLLICMILMLIQVFQLRGDIYFNMLGNYEIGRDWTGDSVASGYKLIVVYCMTTTVWGSILSNYTQKVRDQRDAIGSGIVIALLCALLFFMTCSIVLPFLPEYLTNGTPILSICKDHLNPFLTIVYYIMVVFAACSTGPTFTYNIANRFAELWKSETVSRKTRVTIITFGFLLLCYLIALLGLMFIVQKGYALLGAIAGFAVGIPLVISAFRVYAKDKRDAQAAKNA